MDTIEMLEVVYRSLPFGHADRPGLSLAITILKNEVRAGAITLNAK